MCNWLAQLLGATTHEGLDKKMETLLQWEKEWLILAFDMVSVCKQHALQPHAHIRTCVHMPTNFLHITYMYVYCMVALSFSLLLFLYVHVALLQIGALYRGVCLLDDAEEREEVCFSCLYN